MGGGVWGQFSGAWLACVVIAIAAVWGRYAAAAWEGRSAARELEEHCDPEPMLASSRELRSLCRPTRARERNVWLTYAASEFTALYELGRMDEAEALLTEMEAWTGRPISLLNQTAFAMQKAVLYLRKQKPDAALPWIQQSEQTVRKIAMGQNTYDTYRLALENHRWVYRFLTEGGSQELLRLAFQRLEDAKTLRVQVREHLNVAKCLLDLGRLEEARSHLEFVSANGNKLAVRQKAEERLRELETGR